MKIGSSISDNLKRRNNLSDVNSASTSTTNLDLGTSNSPTFTGTTLSGLTANRALISDGSKAIAVSSVTDTELEYVSGVTSAIQTQINAIVPIIADYITTGKNGDTAGDLSEWTIYKDAASIYPVDGIGGTANITFTRNTTLPMSGIGEFRLAKDAVNRQGEGVSIPFTIQKRHLSKILYGSVDLSFISGTYASDDLRFYIIQDPSGTPVLIEPQNTSIETGVVGQYIRHTFTFQTNNTETSYRLLVHVSSTSALTYTLSFNNFSVWEQSQSIGAIITDWKEYTPTIQGFGTVTGLKALSRRVGSNLEIDVEFNSGTSTANEGRVNLGHAGGNSNVTVDSTKVSTNALVGIGGGDTTTNALTILTSGGFQYVNFSYLNNSATGFIPRNGNSIVGNAVPVKFTASIPIAGWGSSVVMSSEEGDGRTVVCVVRNNSGAACDTTTGVVYTTIVKDSHSIYNVSNGNITIPVNGDYTVSMARTDASSGSDYIGIYRSRNGGSFTDTNLNLCVTGTSTSGYGSVVVPSLSGDVLSIRPKSSSVTLVSNPDTNLCIYRINSGSQSIARDEKVFASYYASASQTSFTTQINFGAKIDDTHDAVTTGASWKFTAPISGVYRITGIIYGNAAGRVELFKNGSLNNALWGFIDGPNYVSSSSLEMTLLKGDYIDLRPAFTMSSTGNALITSPSSQIQISMV